MISAYPTGIQDIEDGSLDIVAVPAIAGVEYLQGDIIVLTGPGGTAGDDLTDAYPIQSLAADSIANLQVAISEFFLGISNGFISSLNTRTDNVLPIATRGRVRLNCTDVVFLAIGQMVAVNCAADGLGTYVPVARTVEATADKTKAIGRIVEPKQATDTTVLVEFRSTITTGPQI